MTRRSGQEEAPFTSRPPRPDRPPATPPPSSGGVADPPPASWSAYAQCPRCPALAGMPCIGGTPHPGRPTVAGPGVLDAVNADLATIDIDKVPGGHTYKAIALWLADVIDKRGQDDGPSVTAKLAERLQVTMQALTRRGGEDGGTFQEFTDSFSQPVR